MQRRLSAQLGSARFARSALRLLQWTQTAAPPGPELSALAPKALARGHRKLLANGRGLRDLSARDRHRVRILAKRQRYAIELLAPFAPVPEPARATRLLARLQQALGEANDAQVARSMLPSLTTSRRILDQVDRWARRGLRRTLPKASNLIKRLERLPRH
jgi:CHAD domain-containing protein